MPGGPDRNHPGRRILPAIPCHTVTAHRLLSLGRKTGSIV